MSKIFISKIPNLNVLVIKQDLTASGTHYFISTKDSIIISIPSLSALVKFLIVNGFMSKKVLEGILSELEE